MSKPWRSVSRTESGSCHVTITEYQEPREGNYDCKCCHGSGQILHMIYRGIGSVPGNQYGPCPECFPVTP